MTSVPLWQEAVTLLGDPNQAIFFGGMGIVSALVFGNMGSAYGTAKSGVGICSVSVLKPELMFKSIIPVVMAGILGIYGLIIAVVIAQDLKATPNDQIINSTTAEEVGKWSYNFASGYKQLAAGLTTGLSSLAAGLTIGVVGDAGVRANGQKDILIVLILMMIFAECLALYGFIIAIVMVTS